MSICSAKFRSGYVSSWGFVDAKGHGHVLTITVQVKHGFLGAKKAATVKRVVDDPLFSAYLVSSMAKCLNQELRTMSDRS